MLTLIANRLARWIKDRRDRARLRRLLAHDDHLLDDIGLTRSDILDALGGSARDVRDEAFRLSRRSLALDARL